MSAGTRLCSMEPSNQEEWAGADAQQVPEEILPCAVPKPWTDPREGVECPSLGTLQSHLDTTPCQVSGMALLEQEG